MEQNDERQISQIFWLFKKQFFFQLLNQDYITKLESIFNFSPRQTDYTQIHIHYEIICLAIEPGPVALIISKNPKIHN